MRYTWRKRASARGSVEQKGKDGPIHMNEFVFVSILGFLDSSGSFYVHLTDDLAARLVKHDAGGVPPTAKGCPWRIINCGSLPGSEQSSGIREIPKIAIGPGIRQGAPLVPHRPARHSLDSGPISLFPQTVSA